MVNTLKTKTKKSSHLKRFILWTFLSERTFSLKSPRILRVSRRVTMKPNPPNKNHHRSLHPIPSAVRKRFKAICQLEWKRKACKALLKVKMSGLRRENHHWEVKDCPPWRWTQASRDSRFLGLPKKVLLSKRGVAFGGGNGGYLRNVRKMGDRWWNPFQTWFLRWLPDALKDAKSALSRGSREGFSLGDHILVVWVFASQDSDWSGLGAAKKVCLRKL